MDNSERKEIIRVSGLTILIVMAVIANLLVIGFVYRWHNYQFFRAEKAHSREYGKLVNDEHMVKNEIVALEGVPTWNDTEYARTLQ